MPSPGALRAWPRPQWPLEAYSAATILAPITSARAPKLVGCCRGPCRSVSTHLVDTPHFKRVPWGDVGADTVEMYARTSLCLSNSVAYNAIDCSLEDVVASSLWLVLSICLVLTSGTALARPFFWDELGFVNGEYRPWRSCPGTNVSPPATCSGELAVLCSADRFADSLPPDRANVYLTDLLLALNRYGLGERAREVEDRRSSLYGYAGVLTKNVIMDTDAQWVALACRPEEARQRLAEERQNIATRFSGDDQMLAIAKLAYRFARMGFTEDAASLLAELSDWGRAQSQSERTRFQQAAGFWYALAMTAAELGEFELAFSMVPLKYRGMVMQVAAVKKRYDLLNSGNKWYGWQDNALEIVIANGDFHRIFDIIGQHYDERLIEVISKSVVREDIEEAMLFINSKKQGYISARLAYRIAELGLPQQAYDIIHQPGGLSAVSGMREEHAAAFANVMSAIAQVYWRNGDEKKALAVLAEGWRLFGRTSCEYEGWPAGVIAHGYAAIGKTKKGIALARKNLSCCHRDNFSRGDNTAEAFVESTVASYVHASKFSAALDLIKTYPGMRETILLAFADVAGADNKTLPVNPASIFIPER